VGLWLLGDGGTRGREGPVENELPRGDCRQLPPYGDPLPSTKFSVEKGGVLHLTLE
jgi:hypothetical protein